MKKFWNYIVNPPTYFIVLNYIAFFVCGGISIVLACVGLGEKFYAFPLYVISVFSLTMVVWHIVKIAPTLKNTTINFLQSHAITKRMMENYGYRTAIFAFLSMILNFIYVLFQGTLAILSKSIWFGALTTYYLILTITKIVLLSSSYKTLKFKQNQPSQDLLDNNSLKENKITQIKIYKATGIFTLILNIALLSASIQLMFSNASFKYAGLLIYAVAAYTFYKITLAIINIFKAKKSDSYIIQAIRNLNFTDALVSLFALQTALIYEFSTGNNMQVFNILTGICVNAMTISLGIFMIVKSTKILKKEKNPNDE